MNTEAATQAEVTQIIADRLSDAQEIRRAKAFPYQLMAAYMNCESGIPQEIKFALQTAMEIATQNVPKIPGRVAVCIDVSGSMGSSVTGYREGATSKIRCVDAAGLMASCILRKNPAAAVIPFECHVCNMRLNPRDSIMTNAQKLASLCGGGTDCSAAMKYIFQKKLRPDVVIFISDNESWMDAEGRRWGNTATLDYWDKIRVQNPTAKLINIDIQPYGTVQAPDRADIANVGGFSDAVFDFVAGFAAESGADHWTDVIEAISL